jgi:preprotein translocase subunit SecG
MIQVILVIQLIVTITMIGLILIQRSEGGGLGIGGGGMGGFASPQSTANALTKATGVLAALFFVANMTLAVMAEGHGTVSIIDHLDKASITQEAPKEDLSKEQAKEAEKPAQAEKKAPSVPVAE